MPISAANSVQVGAYLSSYRLTEVLGKGGFATVFSAWDTRLNRLVAVKVMQRIQEDGDEYSPEQFQREAAMITQLQHPFVIPLYDFGETADLRFLVMRYVAGGTLEQRLAKTPKLPLDTILPLMTQIASALDYIHGQNVVHRDLKPGNVLLDHQGMSYLADFGLAKLMDRKFSQHTIAGTMHFMASEQMVGSKNLSTRADIYSFGILLYRLFTGQLPFDGKQSLGILQLHENAELPDLTTLDPTLPTILTDTLRWATHRDEQARPARASEIAKHVLAIFDKATTASVLTPSVDLEQWRSVEMEIALQRALVAWQERRAIPSLIDFLLLHDAFQSNPALLDAEGYSMMLRAALEYNQFIDYWSPRIRVEAQQQVYAHVLTTGGEEAVGRALGLLTTQSASDAVLEKVAGRLYPSTVTAAASLDVLQRLLPPEDKWTEVDGVPAVVDAQLAALAAAPSPLAESAARFIGERRRTIALRQLISGDHLTAALSAMDATSGKPPALASTPNRWRFWLRLAGRQLYRRSLRRFLYIMLGSVIGMMVMIYATYPDVPDRPLQRPFNAVGIGVLFGTLYGAGVLLSQQISGSLRVLAPPLRSLLALLVGGAWMIFCFSLYQQVVLNDVLETDIAIICGLLYVAGFCFPLDRRLSALAGTLGIFLALYLPWARYISYLDGYVAVDYATAPFMFVDISTATTAIPLILFHAAIVGGASYLAEWRRTTAVVTAPTAVPNGSDTIIFSKEAVLTYPEADASKHKA
ncbi:MAG: serine/threonine protein kinase [Anaerolineae bacterium]|nr:serine/threonine protein kinase [Anaerolineae bacterium]